MTATVDQSADTRLWCLHHIGPDDLYPAPDFETAQQWADYANTHINKGYGGVSRHVVAVWPWTPEGHAEGLAKSITDWTLPTPRPVDQSAVEADQYWITKNGAYYRPNAEGYTNNKAEAGRFTLDEAISYSHPNGPDGPRDGIRYEPAQAMPADPLVGELVAALEKLRLEAAMLLQHSEGCAQNHYGHDNSLYGMPQWLVDCRANIEAVTPLITRARKSGGEAS